MKSKCIKLIALIAAMALLVSMAACQLKEAETTDAADGGSARDEIAATVGETYTITRGEVEDMYNNMITQYSYYGLPAPSTDEDIESMQDMAVEMLVSERVQLYKAEQMGITVDSAMSDQIDADSEDEFDEVYSMFREQAESEGAEDVEARTKEIFSEQLKTAGLDMDMEGYRAYIREQIEKESLSNALIEKVKGEVTVTDEEVRAYYDDLLATQKETYEATPEKYLEEEENFEKFGGDPVLITPDGYVRVKTIMISPTAELGADYETLSGELTTLEAEFGNLSLADAAKNAKRIAEIRTEYAKKKAEADALYEAYIAEARDKADQAYAALKAGQSFDDVLAEYGEDDAYKEYPIFAAEGLLMQKGVASSTWPQELVDAVGKLTDGQYTSVVNLQDVFYIAQLVGPEEVGETPFEDVQEEMHRLTQESKAEDYWNEQLDGWTSDEKIVTLHEDVYRGVGK